MRDASWLDKTIDTHAEFKQILIFHVDNSYTTAPQCYSYAYIVCFVLSLCWQIIFLIYNNNKTSTCNVPKHIL